MFMHWYNTGDNNNDGSPFSARSLNTHPSMKVQKTQTTMKEVHAANEKL